MKAHPATDLFPMMGEQELTDLSADIKAHGLQVPIVVYQDQILDGRNRWLACEMAGVTPRTVEWDGMGSPTVWVISLNLHRRHLTASQRAAIAVDVLPVLEWEAKKRQLAGVNLPALMPEGPGESREQAAEMFNVSPRYVADAKKLKADAPDLYAEVRQGDKTITEAKRELKERGREDKREQNRQLVQGTVPLSDLADYRFPCIALDPPWDWGDEGDQDQFGRARPTYDTMPYSEIAALPVPALAQDNAHIYLWITNRSLPKGFALLEEWGFRYVTMLTWCKPSIGMGNYFRGSTEQVLFGVRGSLPLLRRDVGTWFLAARPGGHSAKPVQFYEMVEACSPGPWLEMFSRQGRKGWVVWGAEVETVRLQ